MTEANSDLVAMAKLSPSMIKSTISVITNVRPDHIDEMGLTLKDNTMSLSNTNPY